jgi:type IV fimbrial biogenesis protein FimT
MPMRDAKAFRTARRSEGFTIVELMVTIAVAAILVAIATPSLTTFIQNSRETSEANSLVMSLDYARSEAIKEDAPVEVCASADPYTACSGDVAAGGWATGWIVQTTANPPIVLQVMPVLGGGNTLSASFNGNNVSEVTFQPNGFVQAAGGANVFKTTYFTLCDTRGATYARDIEVTAIGGVQSSPTPGQDLLSPPQALACP